MKKYYILLLPLFALFSCSNDNVLSKSDELNLAISQAINPIEKFLGDTVKINLLMSINDDEINRIEILEVSSDVEDLREDIRFTLIDNTKPLTVDKNGYLSRGVSSMMMIHPVVVNKDQSLYDRVLQIRYRVTTVSGKSKSITAEIKVINYINNTVMVRFPYVDIKENAMFYDPVANCSYTKEDYKQNINNIDVVVYADASKKYYCLNPAAIETEELLKSLGFSDYDASEMRDTKFVKSPEVNYFLLNEKEIKDLSFESSVDKVNLATDNLCSFLTVDNKKGCIRVKIASNVFNVASKMEAVIR